MFTRTIVDAVVVYDLIAKVDGRIVSERKTEQLEKCANKDKAELILSKKHKGSLIDIQSVVYNKTTYAQNEEDFFKTAKVVKTEEVKEAESEDKIAIGV